MRARDARRRLVGGLVVGRLASMAVDGAPGGFVFRLLAAETTGALLSALLLASRARERF